MICPRFDRTEVEQRLSRTQASELYEFPYLKRFPLFRLRSPDIAGIAGCLRVVSKFTRLSNVANAEPFSKVFEHYVVN